MLYQFWITFIALILLIAFFEKKYGMLRDMGNPDRKPYSWARVQLAWWSVIILSSVIAIMWEKGNAPDLQTSTIILLGISGATICTARVIDAQAETKQVIGNEKPGGSNLLLDILSDGTGPSIHRFQTLVFNIAFGCWYIQQVHANFSKNINDIIPIITDNNLILLGLSSATYAALKTTEKKEPKQKTQDVTVETTEPAIG